MRIIWNRINLAIAMRCLPSEIGNESSKDIQAIQIILSAKAEMDKREQGDD